MPPLTPVESELSILRSELQTIQTKLLLGDALQRQTLLLTWLDVLQRTAPIGSTRLAESDCPTPSTLYPFSWTSFGDRSMLV